MVVGAGAAVAVGSGRLILGLVLIVSAAIPTCSTAPWPRRPAGRPRGAFFDSVADRVTDSLLLGGVAWYLAGHDSADPPCCPSPSSPSRSLISYERAKAESLGFDAKGGLMERAERMNRCWCIGLPFALLVPVLWVMLALTTLTAVQRFVRVWRQAARCPVTGARIGCAGGADRAGGSPAASERATRLPASARLTHVAPARSDLTRPAAGGERRERSARSAPPPASPDRARLRRRGRGRARSALRPTLSRPTVPEMVERQLRRRRPRRSRLEAGPSRAGIVRLLRPVLARELPAAATAPAARRGRLRRSRATSTSTTRLDEGAG